MVEAATKLGVRLDKWNRHHPGATSPFCPKLRVDKNRVFQSTLK